MIVVLVGLVSSRPSIRHPSMINLQDTLAVMIQQNQAEKAMLEETFKEFVLNQLARGEQFPLQDQEGTDVLHPEFEVDKQQIQSEMSDELLGDLVVKKQQIQLQEQSTVEQDCEFEVDEQQIQSDNIKQRLENIVDKVNQLLSQEIGMETIAIAQRPPFGK